MIGFKLIGLTEVGSIAIKRHLDERISQRLNPSNVMYKQMFRETLESDVHPVVLAVHVKSRLLRSMLDFSLVSQQIVKAFQENGAINNIDYEIEVLEE